MGEDYDVDLAAYQAARVESKALGEVRTSELPRVWYKNIERSSVL